MLVPFSVYLDTNVTSVYNSVSFQMLKEGTWQYFSYGNPSRNSSESAYLNYLQLQKHSTDFLISKRFYEVKWKFWKL